MGIFAVSLSIKTIESKYLNAAWTLTPFFAIWCILEKKRTQSQIRNPRKDSLLPNLLSVEKSAPLSNPRERFNKPNFEESTRQNSEWIFRCRWPCLHFLFKILGIKQKSRALFPLVRSWSFSPLLIKIQSSVPKSIGSSNPTYFLDFSGLILGQEMDQVWSSFVSSWLHSNFFFPLPLTFCQYFHFHFDSYFRADFLMEENVKNPRKYIFKEEIQEYPCIWEHPRPD